MTRERAAPSGGNAGTLLALIRLLFVGGGLLFLTALVLPQALGLFLVVLGFASIALLHYFVWGRWLSRQIADEEAATRAPAED